jgi:hypothetical protein
MIMSVGRREVFSATVCEGAKPQLEETTGRPTEGDSVIP